jgi:hypothetical protein
MVEVELEHGGLAGVPQIFGDGELKQQGSLSGGLCGDGGIAEEGGGEEWQELREAGLLGLRVGSVGGPDGEDGVGLVGEGEGRLFESDRYGDTVLELKGWGEEEDVLGVGLGDHDGVGLEDSAGGDDLVMEDRDLHVRCGEEMKEHGDPESQDHDGGKDGNEEGTALLLGEGGAWDRAHEF